MWVSGCRNLSLNKIFYNIFISIFHQGEILDLALWLEHSIWMFAFVDHLIIIINVFCHTSNINLQNLLHANLNFRVRKRILTVYWIKFTPFNHDFCTLHSCLRKYMISKLHKRQMNDSCQSKLTILVVKQGVRSPVPSTIWVCLR